MHALLILTAVLSTAAPDATNAPPAATAPTPAATASAPDVPTASEPSRPDELPSTAATPPSVDKYHLLEMQATQPRAEPNMGGRIVLESLAGLGFGVLGALGGALGSVGDPSGLMALVLTPACLVAGSSLGVQLVGAAMQGQGDYGITLLGSLAGFAVPVLIGAATLPGACGYGGNSGDCASTLQFVSVTAILLPVVGAIIAYEASSASNASRPTAKHLVRAPRIVPLLAPAPQGIGATAGLVGIF